MKIISTNNNHLCIDSGNFETYKKDGKNYCYYEAEQGNINDLFEKLLNNILIFNNSIDKVKIAVEPIKIDSKDSIVLYNKNGEKIENNKIEEELDVLDEQTIFNFSNNYYFEVSDALYEKYCAINSETTTCKIEDMKLFNVYVKIKYKSRTDYNDLNLTSPNFDLILNKAEKLN